jgi:hypothetical protein
MVTSRCGRRVCGEPVVSTSASVSCAYLVVRLSLLV